MLLSYSRLPTPPTPAVPNTQLKVVAVPDNHPSHADYNLRPLEVHSLDHYVQHEDENERFHVH